MSVFLSERSILLFKICTLLSNAFNGNELGIPVASDEQEATQFASRDSASSRIFPVSSWIVVDVFPRIFLAMSILFDKTSSIVPGISPRIFSA